MRVVFRPNFKMMLCGLFNGDIQTYTNKMIELDHRFKHSNAIRCAHIPPRPYDKDDIGRPLQLDIYEVQLEMVNLLGNPFLAGRCLTCGRIFYCTLPIP